MSNLIQRKERDDHGRVIQPALLKCECGKIVEFWSHHDETCSCGREYNCFGQMLAPRSQWGEETGETLGEILSGWGAEDE